LAMLQSSFTISGEISNTVAQFHGLGFATVPERGHDRVGRGLEVSRKLRDSGFPELCPRQGEGK
jgi:hypothetical protein